jgi:signal transduction histidine kinase/CheY-like chemotaxis protein/HAMP domain-containing protein
VSSTFIYYGLAGTLISKQQNQVILNATNDFVFTFEKILQKPEEDFTNIISKTKNFKNLNLDSTSIDFIFTLVGDTLINFNEYSAKRNSFINIQSKSFKQFFKYNPNVILQYRKLDNSQNVFYGRLITSVLLDSIARDIHTDIALVINDSPVDISNSAVNQKYLLSIINAERSLKFKNNFDLYSEELENSDFVASYFTPRQILTPGGKINFIIFNSFQESAELKSTLKNVAIIIVLAGSALTFIFVLLFTAKLRKQISLLGEAVELTRKGNLDHRVAVIAKDEVGQLGEAFNEMLDEIKKKNASEQEYTEFISMIIRNPSLQEVSDSALSKIIKTTGLTFGVFYIVSKKNIRVISSYGIGKNLVLPPREADFYSNAIEKGEVVEFEFHENYPEIKTGIASVKIKYLLVYPIIYNKETIAILELAGESAPQTSIRKYIESIQDQLAVGLVNARTLEQLENLVKELQVLNDDYQMQNMQIVEQNQKLKELHEQLKIKADELETQRAKAIELTKVKSQFLASMSHELRTPLISILGLTELMAKDTAINPKTMERINIVYRNGKKLLSMITNILEFSKFDSDKIEIRNESFLLDDLIDEIFQGIELIAKEKSLELQIDKEPRANLVLNTDRIKLEHVLNNLLVNAVKFTEKGRVQLKIKLIGNEDVEFCVNDTGIGIPTNEQEKIFAEFQQVDSGTERKFGGVGLGLAISKKYIELLGSEIKLESKPGEGTQFSFILKNIVLDILDAVELPGEINSNKPPQKENVVLLIADNMDTEKLFADYFSEYGVEIYRVASYDKAIEAIGIYDFHSIIAIPLKSGNLWKFINDIKESGNKNTPKLFIIPLIEEDKTGWQLVVDDFIPIHSAPTKLVESLTQIREEARIKFIDTLVVSENKDTFENIISIIEPTFHSTQITSASNLYKRIKTEIPDAIVLDVESIGKDAIAIVYKIRAGKATKKVPVIFLMPDIFPDDLASQINDELVAVTKKAEGNILDVLKELKAGLKISKETEIAQPITIEEPANIINTDVVASDKFSDSKQLILIVDDDNDSLFTIGEIVKELNYETMFAHNGMECLIMLNHVVPDLILLDIMMPQMNGFETIKRIRADKKFKGVPVLALTAYAMLENKNVIEKNGFSGLITKPVNSKVLASKIKESIKTKVTVL